MEKNIKKLLEDTKKKNKKNKELLQKLREIKSAVHENGTGNNDAQGIADRKDVVISAESTPDRTYGILIEKMHEGAVTLNADGTILYCNFSFANMVRLPIPQVIGEHFTNFIEKTAIENFSGLMKKALKNTVKEEMLILPGDKTSIPVLMSINSFPIDNATVFSVIITDLTMQYRNQEEFILRAKELDKKNIELEKANAKLSIQSEEKEKRTAELNILLDNLKTQREELEKLNNTLYEKTLLLQQQDEELVIVNNDLVLLNEDLEKRVLERTADLEKLNKELNDLSLAKNKFLSVISHDLRNPFAALLIAADLLKNKTEAKIFEDLHPLVTIINRTSHRIFQQINELIDWAQTQREKPGLMPEKIELSRGVNQSLELLRVIAVQKNIALENKVPADFYVKADYIMLRSIIQNLVTNAIKYTPQNGLIIVNADRTGKMIEVSICDYDTGANGKTDESVLSKSFSDSMRTTSDETGIAEGLLLVEQFVLRQGGNIRMEGKTGNGACIIFTIPQW